MGGTKKRMKKRNTPQRIILKLRDGNLEEQGFSASIESGEEGGQPTERSEGHLPAHPEILEPFGKWQTAFETKAGVRLVPTRPPQTFSCEESANRLRKSFNDWLNRGDQEEWKKIRDVLLTQAKHNEGTDDVTRIIVQTNDSSVWQLPWSALDLSHLKIKAEIAFSLSEWKGEKVRLPRGTKVRILAVFGDNKGINTDVDRLLLQAAPQAEIGVLTQPSKAALFRYLLNPDGWHIFFFAGHSRTDEEGEFQINQKESLTIGALKHHLKTAIENGLQLAIFNSCDGIGLAKDLAKLNLPQSIVMRLPVPDKVAQRFLELFLARFAKQGESLYAAVYETRGLLADQFGKEYPGVEWLPMICQNPAAATVAGSWGEWTQAGERFQNLVLLILLPVIGYGLYPAVLDRSLETVGMKQVTYEYEVRDYSDRVDYKWEDMNKAEGLLSLYEGDQYKIRYIPLDDSYVYVYQWSDRGEVYDLVSKYKMERQVKGGQENLIPPDDPGRLVLAPTGVRKICVLAFKQPNPYLDQQVVKDEIITGNSLLQYYLWDPRDYLDLDKNCPKENKVTFKNKGPRPSP